MIIYNVLSLSTVWTQTSQGRAQDTETVKKQAQHESLLCPVLAWMDKQNKLYSQNI